MKSFIKSFKRLAKEEEPLHWFWWGFLPVGLFLMISLIIFIDNQELLIILGSHDDGKGIFDYYLTPLVLLVGVFYSSKIIIFTWKKKDKRLLFIFGVLSLGFFFFVLGEETSWAQWYLGYETPENIKIINIQKEFNLHNINLWRYPISYMQNVLDILVFIFGVYLPFKRIKQKKPLAYQNLLSRFLPTVVFIIPSIILLLFRIEKYMFEYIDEFFELYTIGLILLYVVSVYKRFLIRDARGLT